MPFAYLTLRWRSWEYQLTDTDACYTGLAYMFDLSN